MRAKDGVQAMPKPDRYGTRLRRKHAVIANPSRPQHPGSRRRARCRIDLPHGGRRGSSPGRSSCRSPPWGRSSTTIGIARALRVHRCATWHTSSEDPHPRGQRRWHGGLVGAYAPMEPCPVGSRPIIGKRVCISQAGSGDGYREDPDTWGDRLSSGRCDGRRVPMKTIAPPRINARGSL